MQYYSHIDNEKLILTECNEYGETGNTITLYPMDKNTTYINRLSTQIFDTEEEAFHFIKDNKKYYRMSMYATFQLHGYELINDNHYIKLYYEVISSNS